MTQPTTPDTDQSTPAPPETGDANRRGGDRAILAELAAERDKRQELESKLQPLQPILDLLGGNGTGNPANDLQAITDRLGALDADLASERSARFRAEVAMEQGLTPEQAALLPATGTKDDIAAFASRLLAAFPAPATASGEPGTPAPPAALPAHLRPDPAQGPRPGVAPDHWAEGKARAAAMFGTRQNPGT